MDEIRIHPHALRHGLSTSLESGQEATIAGLQSALPALDARSRWLAWSWLTGQRWSSTRSRRQQNE